MDSIFDVPERSVFFRIQIDTNRINSRNALPAMNRLEQWRRDEVIEILTSEVAVGEMRQGGDSARAAKASGMIFSMTLATSPDEPQELELIEAIMFPQGARTQSQHNDVEIVFNANKYMAILVTNDGGSRRQPGGILGNAERLHSAIGVKIMRDVDAVALIEQRIQDRDENARMICRQAGLPLPYWVGQD